MGQKAHPRGFRLSFHKDHYLSSWFASNSGHLFSSPSYTDDKIQKQLAVMTVENDQSKVDTAGSGNADAASRVRIDTPSKGQVDHLAKKNLYSLFVYEDFLIREFFYKELQITNVIIKRKQKTLTVHLEANLNAMSNLMRSCEAASSQNKGKVGVSTDQDRAESTASSSKLRYLETLKIKLTKLLKKKNR
jgi:hypothetical protein